MLTLAGGAAVSFMHMTLAHDAHRMCLHEAAKEVGARISNYFARPRSVSDHVRGPPSGQRAVQLVHRRHDDQPGPLRHALGCRGELSKSDHSPESVSGHETGQAYDLLVDGRPEPAATLAITLSKSLRHADPHALMRFACTCLQVQHYPYYFTMGKGDFKGNECMRQTYEPLFYQYGVDISLSGAPRVMLFYIRSVFAHECAVLQCLTSYGLANCDAGHVHAYERTNPMLNYTSNACGTTHVLIGALNPATFP